VVSAWCPASYPAVDIYLPICGEPIEVLRNTWRAVSELAAHYDGTTRVYVLDDGQSDDAAALANSIGIGYLRRPEPGAWKKSGNLRYAFACTSGEFLVILDADFAPRRDFLAETLPYLDDPLLAIVQTPQFFRASSGQTWVENAAGAVQEVFYRSIQVARNRFGAAICVGTSAVYRRAALEPQGGPTLIPYAEDVHTGLDVRRVGWSMVYLPIVLSAGMCPDNLDAFVRQQYRWCTGNAGVVFSRRLWSVPMSVPARLTYISGFFYYAYTAMLTIAGPVIPVTLLALLPGQIRLRNFIVLLPAMLAGFVLYPLWHRAPYGPSVWPLGLARGWAHVLAIWDGLRGETMSWHPSRTPGSSLRRFRVGVVAWSGGVSRLTRRLAHRHHAHAAGRGLVAGGHVQSGSRRPRHLSWEARMSPAGGDPGNTMAIGADLRCQPIPGDAMQASGRALCSPACARLLPGRVRRRGAARVPARHRIRQRGG
jgi:cellulose synthase (UDP-forming)